MTARNPLLPLLLACSLAMGTAPLAAAADQPPPMTIEEAQALAKKNAPTLLTAREKLVQADLLIDKAWVMMKPQINATGTYTHNNVGMALDLAFPNFADPNSIILNPTQDPTICKGQIFCFNPDKMINYDVVIQKQDTFGFYATLTQPLFIARAFTTIANAHNAYDIAKVNTENVEDFMMYTVATAYFGTLTTQKFVDIARDSVATRGEHLKIAQAKFEAGDSPKINVLRAEIDLNHAQQDLKRAEISLELAKEAIRLLIGRNEDFSLVEPESAQRPTDTMERFIEQALAQRRDLISARLGLSVAETQKKDAWYRFIPSLVFNGMFRAADVKGFSDSYTSWSVGLALAIPLYDGGQRYTELEEAESKIREATIQITEKERSIRSEIRQLWLKMEMAEANLAKAHRTVELAKESASLAKSVFEAGASTNLEVVDANTMLFSTQINEVTEQMNLQLTILRLNKAIRMFDPSGGMGAGAGGMGGQPGEGMEGGAPAEGAEGQGGMGGAGGMPMGGGMSGMGF